VIVGSGRLTFTSLGAAPWPGSADQELRLFQLPVTHYRTARRWAMSPGYDRPGQQRFGREISAQCLFCHTDAQRPLPGRASSYRRPLGLGLRCARCHGPGEEHVRYRQAAATPADPRGARAEPRTDPLVFLTRLPEDRRQDVCLACHLEGSARVLRQGRESIQDFRPGEPLGDLLLVFREDPPEERLFTHSSHGERFLLSPCAQTPDAPLRCRECHPPHGPSPKDPLSYTRVCLRCHRPEGCTRVPRLAAERKSAKDPCIDCHMTWDGTSDIPFIASIDHRIQRPAERGSAGAGTGEPTTHVLRTRPRDELRLVRVTHPQQLPAEPGELDAAEAEALLEVAREEPAPRLLRQATAALDRAEAAAPSSLRWLRLRARLQQAQGQHAERCRTLGRIVAVDRRDHASWLALGICRGERGDPQGAGTALAEALRLEPNLVEARNRLAFLRLLQGDPAGAARGYQEALARDPTNAALHANLAVLRFQQGELGPAEQSWQEAVRLDPTLAPAVEGLREVQARQGRPGEALRWARQAARLLPTDLTAQRRLGELARVVGETALAQQAFRAALRLQPADPALRHALQELGGVP